MRFFAACVSVLLISGLFSGEKGVIAQVARIFGSIAIMGESAAAITSTAVEVGSVITASMSLLALSVANNSATLAAELWSGIDLLNVTLIVKHGKVAADDGSTIAVWLNGSAGGRLVPVSDEAKLFMSDAALSVGVSMPLVHMHDAQLHVASGLFAEVEAEARLISSGHVVLLFTSRQVQFAPQWANPLWGWLELDVQVQHDAISRALVIALDSMPYVRHNWSDFGSAQAATAPLPQIIEAKIRRACRLMTLTFKNVINFFFVPDWVWPIMQWSPF
jgi:hypothetical protein